MFEKIRKTRTHIREITCTAGEEKSALLTGKSGIFLTHRFIAFKQQTTEKKSGIVDTVVDLFHTRVHVIYKNIQEHTNMLYPVKTFQIQKAYKFILADASLK